jgi:hypothetical protein
MTPTQTCPRCGRPNLAANSFCAGCGANLSSREKGNGWKVFFGAFALFVGIIWAAVIFTKTTPPAASPASYQPQSLLSPSATPAPTGQSAALTSTQHLAEAKRALADGYKPDKDPKKASWGNVTAAKWHLNAISSGAAEYREAQELLKEVARRERQVELAKRQPVASPAAEDADESVADEDEDSSEGTSSDESSTSSASAGSGRSSHSAGSAGESSSEDYYTNSDGIRVHRPVRNDSGPPAGATAQCRDGSYSFSLHRSGTCSHHGGVAKWL